MECAHAIHFLLHYWLVDAGSHRALRVGRFTRRICPCLARFLPSQCAAPQRTCNWRVHESHCMHQHDNRQRNVKQTEASAGPPPDQISRKTDKAIFHACTHTTHITPRYSRFLLFVDLGGVCLSLVAPECFCHLCPQDASIAALQSGRNEGACVMEHIYIQSVWHSQHRDTLQLP